MGIVACALFWLTEVAALSYGTLLFVFGILLESILKSMEMV